jgi:hypothetical protein
MKIKITCVAILLAFGFLAATASADENYRVTLSSVSKIGNAEFQAGDYKLAGGGSKVVFTELKTGKSVEMAAKVEVVEKKFGTTEIHSRKVDGASQISEIRIGGSKTRVVFD